MPYILYIVYILRLFKEMFNMVLDDIRKVMLASVNYYFLHQELCLFVCLQACKKLHSPPSKPHSL